MLVLLMLLSQRLDPSRNESYNLIKMCKCVDSFLWRVDELLCMIHLSSLFSMDVDYLSLFFDMPCGHVAYLLWVCIFYFEHAEACGIPSLGMHLLFLFV